MWLGKVASGSATQGLWLGDRKVGSQVVGKDRSQLSGIETVGEVRREYTGLELGERDEQVACHVSALVMTEEACLEAEL